MKNLFSSLFNRNNNLPLIIDEFELNDFNDLTFKIIKKEKFEEGYIFTVKGNFESQIVGFNLFIKNNMQPGVKDDDLDNDAFYSDSIIFSSIGEESDQFISALNKVYGFNSSKFFRKESIKTTAFPLNSIIADLDKANYYKYKVFFEQDELYAELYINIDLKSEILEFHEKDIVYREDILKALT